MQNDLKVKFSVTGEKLPLLERALRTISAQYGCELEFEQGIVASSMSMDKMATEEAMQRCTDICYTAEMKALIQGPPYINPIRMDGLFEQRASVCRAYFSHPKTEASQHNCIDMFQRLNDQIKKHLNIL